MMGLHSFFQRAQRRLKRLVAEIAALRAAGDAPDKRRAESLSTLISVCDQLAVVSDGACGAPRLTREAIALLECCDPLARLRTAKLAYVDTLASTCDALMTAGQMPDPRYLSALAAAACDFEAEHAEREQAELSLAWDILAQAEAGLGQPTDDAHYRQAEQRYGRAQQRSEPPVLSLVASTVR